MCYRGCINFSQSVQRNQRILRPSPTIILTRWVAASSFDDFHRRDLTLGFDGFQRRTTLFPLQRPFECNSTEGSWTQGSHLVSSTDEINPSRWWSKGFGENRIKPRPLIFLKSLLPAIVHGVIGKFDCPGACITTIPQVITFIIGGGTRHQSEWCSGCQRYSPTWISREFEL